MNANINLLIFDMIQEVSTENAEGVGNGVGVSWHVQHIYLSVYCGFAAKYISNNY